MLKNLQISFLWTMSLFSVHLINVKNFGISIVMVIISSINMYYFFEIIVCKYQKLPFLTIILDHYTSRIFSYQFIYFSVLYLELNTSWLLYSIYSLTIYLYKNEMSTMVPDIFMESKLVCYLSPLGIFSYQKMMCTGFPSLGI